MKKGHNLRVSKRLRKVLVAMLLLGMTQPFVGCYSYKPTMAPTADPAMRRSELVKRVTPGRHYEIALNDGKKVKMKVSTITAEAIFGAIVLKDADGERLYSPMGKAITDQNYRVLLSEVADIRERKMSGGRTAVVIAVPSVAVVAIFWPMVADGLAILAFMQ